MAYIKPSKPFNQELEKVLAYALFEFGVTTVKRFNQAYPKAFEIAWLFTLTLRQKNLF